MELNGTMEIDGDGVLNIAGIDVCTLAEDFGTPLIVMDEAEIRSNIRSYIEAFEKYYDDYMVLYAGKAFYNRTLFRIMADEGAGIDVVSGGELYTALEADFPVEKIYFHGNNKLSEEIKMGLDCNIGRFVVDNMCEVKLLEKLVAKKNAKIKVDIRLTPGIEAHTHEFIQTGQIDSKFGVSLVENQALNLVKEIVKNENMILKGLHAHIGSQIFDILPYKKLVEVMFDFMVKVREETGKEISELDFGGGLGISYVSQDDPPAVDEFVRELCKKVKVIAEERNYSLPRIIVEPGRSIVGTAGTTLYKVGSIKQVPGMTRYAAVDGGMTDNIRPALYDAVYDAFVANRADENVEEVYTIAGKCCESGDILIKDIELPLLKPGDLIAVTSTGAYTYAMSSNYNGVPRPAVVLVNEGEANVIIERENFEDLIKNDVIPSGY